MSKKELLKFTLPIIKKNTGDNKILPKNETHLFLNIMYKILKLLYVLKKLPMSVTIHVCYALVPMQSKQQTRKKMVKIKTHR